NQASPNQAGPCPPTSPPPTCSARRTPHAACSTWQPRHSRSGTAPCRSPERVRGPGSPRPQPTSSRPCSALHPPASACAPQAPAPWPGLHRSAGPNRSGVPAAVASGVESDTGPARLAVLARDAHLAEQLVGAHAWLDSDALRPPGVAFRETPISGETAFVYTKGSAFYPGMGSDLALGFAPLADGMDEAALVSWIYEGSDSPNDSLDQILAVGFIARLHTRITREVLGIEPQAAIGYSSGESAALVALGVWNDVTAMSVDARASGLFSHDLGGELRAVRRFW